MFSALTPCASVRRFAAFSLVGGVAPGVVRGLVLAAEMAAKTAAAGGDAQLPLVAPKARGRPPTPGGKNAMKRYVCKVSTRHLQQQFGKTQLAPICLVLLLFLRVFCLILCFMSMPCRGKEMHAGHVDGGIWYIHPEQILFSFL